MPRLTVPLIRTGLYRAPRVFRAPSRFSALRLHSFPQITAVQPLLQTLPLRSFTSLTSRRTDKPVWPYLYKPYDKMAHLDPYFQQVDTLQDNFIERLREAVAIPSISSEDERRPDVVKVRHMRACATARAPC